MTSNQLLFNGNSQNDFSLVDIINEDNFDDNSINLFNYSHYYDADKAVEFFNDGVETFNILSLNCQSLHAKFSELQIYLEAFINRNVNIDIICLQETWLSEQCDVSLLSLEGYNFIMKGKHCSAHGGVAIYLHTKYNYKILNICDSDTWDGQFIEISSDDIIFNGNSNKLILCNIYRPPRPNVADVDNFVDEIGTVFHNLQRYRNVVITGDFNIDLLKCKENLHINQYLDTIIANGYVPKITFPTRLTHEQGSLIDNIFMKINDNIFDCKAGIILSSISDHLPCFIRLTCCRSQQTSKFIQISSYCIAAVENFRKYLKDSKIYEKLNITHSSCPNENYEIFNDILQVGVNRFFGARTVKYKKHRHRKSPWISYGIVKSIKYRDKLYVDLKKTRRQDANYENKVVNLRTYNCILRKCIRHAKKLYYNNCFESCKNDIKATWKNINIILNRTKKKKDFPKHFLVNGDSVSDPAEIVNKFNFYFTNIGPELAQKIDPPRGENFTDYLDAPAQSKFDFVPTTTDKIIEVINNLKSKTSQGIDKISNKLLKEIKYEISDSLMIIINQCLAQGTFPNLLKIAKVIPLFKKGEHFLFSNYRPVSILPSISKIFEKIISSQIYSYFIENNLFFHSQYGFRSLHSTELATIELLDKLIYELDKGEIPISIFLDLSKAFDTIDHSVLIFKLKHYGFYDNSLKLIENYLSERYQYVQINDIKSEQCSLSTGVPQGSILGPLLFIIYVNDLHRINSCFTPILYADDTTLTASLNKFKFTDENVNCNINTQLEKFSTWFKLNKLSLNCKKTSAMIFHMPNKSIEYPEIKIDGENITFVKEFNFLGTLLHENLNWKSHIDYCAKKISKVVGVLNKLKNTLPQNTLLTIYNSLIVPHLNYGAMIWEGNISRLVILQKRAIRAVCNAVYNAHTSIIFKNLKILKCQDICALHCFKFCFKLENKMLPDYFYSSGVFKKLSHVHDYPSRGSNNYVLPRIKHEFARQGIRYKAALVFNNMQKNVKDKIFTHSLTGFKTYIKKLMIDSYDSVCLNNNCYICNRQNNS